MNKKQMSEQDIRSKFIMPAIIKSGWDLQKQIREEVPFTEGKVIVQGTGKIVKRGQQKIPDYILYYTSSMPIAVVEAKKNTIYEGGGIQQASDYAENLQIFFAFSSNGDSFIFKDLYTGEEKQLSMDEFPTPEELWEKYKKYKGITKEDEEKLLKTEFYYEKDWKEPRYYQRIAVNKVIEEIAKGRKKLLLVMATGTGKTYNWNTSYLEIKENTELGKKILKTLTSVDII